MLEDALALPKHATCKLASPIVPPLCDFIIQNNLGIRVAQTTLALCSTQYTDPGNRRAAFLACQQLEDYISALPPENILPTKNARKTAEEFKHE